MPIETISHLTEQYFCRYNAPSDIQTTVSKHWIHQ